MLPTAATPGNVTVTFTTGATVPGGVLGITMEATGDGLHLEQMIFDNVTLMTAVPEPASWFLCALGGLGIALAGMRRRAFCKA